MYFITLTLDEEHYPIAKKDHYYFIRKWLERYRYLTGESLRHFIVTELGDKTGRLHYHGIVFGSKLKADDLLAQWKFCSPKNKYAGYVLPKTASYIVKYILKPNNWEDISDWYTPRRYVSRGLGKCYCEDPINQHAHNKTNTGKWICVFDGYVLPVPRYYRDHLFNDDTIYNYRKYYYENPPDEWSIKTPSLSATFNCFHDYVECRKNAYKDSQARRMSPQEPYRYTTMLLSDDFSVQPNLLTKQYTLWDF